jgi:hypothetical protein
MPKLPIVPQRNNELLGIKEVNFYEASDFNFQWNVITYKKQ